MHYVCALLGNTYPCWPSALWQCHMTVTLQKSMWQSLWKWLTPTGHHGKFPSLTFTYKILLPSYSSVIHCRVEKHLMSHGNLNMNTSTKTNMKVVRKSTQKIHIRVQESYSKCSSAVSDQQIKAHLMMLLSKSKKVFLCSKKHVLQELFCLLNSLNSTTNNWLFPVNGSFPFIRKLQNSELCVKLLK